MKKFLTPLVFILAVSFLPPALHAQNKRGFRKEKLFQKDSFAIKIQNIKDSVEKTLREVKAEENIGKNVETLLKLNEENKAKQKKAAMIRIGIGVALLALLIVGLLRRRAKK